MKNGLVFKEQTYNQLIYLCRNAYPQKAYGVIAGRGNKAEAIYPFSQNMRAVDPEVNSFFESYGDFYCDRTRGFWAEPEEQIKILNEIKGKGLKPLAVYHTHRCIMDRPSQIDIDLHFSSDVLMVIVFLADPISPVVRAYKIIDKTYQEVGIEVI